MKTETNEYGLEILPETPHLGGFVAGGDPLTFNPKLWEWFIAEHGVASVIDVGCGDGSTLPWWDERGVMATGIDGVASPGVRVHDYTAGPYEPGMIYDLAWSAEFVEHVEERYVSNFLATFAAARMVAMTHAVPGQGGYHHVHCRTGDYWKGQLHHVGHRYDRDLTKKARELAAEDNPHSYFAKTGLVFKMKK